MTDAAGSDMILTAVAIIFITAIAFVIAYFVGSLSTLEKQDHPAVLSVDKHKVENCLSLDEKILDFNKFNDSTLRDCVKSGVMIKVSDLEGNLVKEFDSGNELSRRFPLCSIEESRFKCKEYSGRYLVENDGVKDYLLEISLVTKNV